MGPMLEVYEVVRVLHIVGGALGLVSMFVPLFSRKGSPIHRRVGRVFAWSMLVAGATGVVMAAAWLLVPSAFATPDRLVEQRIRGMFLGSVGLLLLCAVQQMLRSLTRKRNPAPAPTRLDLALPGIMVAFGASTVVVGAIYAAMLPVVFGVIATSTGIADLRFVTRPLSTPKAWWYQHMRGAMVAIVSGVTAFAVLGGNRFLRQVMPADLVWVPWIAPSVVLVPLFLVWIGRWKRRFGEAAATPR